MTPREFITQLKARPPAPAYLFLGPEFYQRRTCASTLVERFLSRDDAEYGVARFDLQEVTLSHVLDDASSLSLFAPRRVIFVSNAEAVLPRGRSAADEEEEGGKAGPGGADLLARYMKDPTPGVVLVFEATRFGFEGEDKARLERVRKFYSAVSAQVEFRHFSEQEALGLALNLARRSGLDLDEAAIELLVEACGADAARIATEIDKLTLATRPGQRITADLVAAMTPDARVQSIFALAAALGRRDRKAALDILDTLVKEGEYLPLALAFLATQLRFALAAHEAGLRHAGQIQSHFTRQGTPMWRGRAEQVAETVAAFRPAQIEAALQSCYRADKAFRSPRPDDKTVMEEFILTLAG